MLNHARPIDPQPTAEALIQCASEGERYFGRRLWSAQQAALDVVEHGFVPCDTPALSEAHAFSESLMGVRLAPLWALASAHMYTGGAAWVRWESDVLTGVYLFLPLSWDGEASLRTARFNYAAPRLDDLCQPGEEVSAVYLWFIGGTTRDTRQAIRRTTSSWMNGALSGLRFYGRAASDAGARGLARRGFQPLAPERSDLYILSGEPEAVA